MRNILIIRDNLWKTDRKMKDGLRCLIIYILLLTTKIYQHCLHYFRQYVCWLLLYPQDCILHWIYGMQINYITWHQIVSELIHLWRFTANHSIASLAWVHEFCLQTFGRTTWTGDQLIMKLQPSTTQTVSKCRKLCRMIFSIAMYSGCNNGRFCRMCNEYFFFWNSRL